MSKPPVIGVLALQGDVIDHVRHLEAAGARVMTVRRRRELEQVDGLVLPGGESSAMVKLLDVFDMFDPVAQALQEGMPAFGTCAGMIMLATDILDGIAGQRGFAAIPMTVRRNAFGRQVDSYEEDLEPGVFGGQDPLRAVFIRAPWVEQTGPGVEVLARTRAGAAATGAERGRIVAVKYNAMIATSFHPEMVDDIRVHRYFVELVQAGK